MILDIWILVVLLIAALAVLAIMVTRRCLPIPAQARVLLVVAHPDDETMFFGPTVLEMVARNAKVFVLCASTGDFYGLGEKRKREMFDACQALGVSRADVTIMDVSDMKDGQTKWETEKLARIVLQCVERLGAQVVVTFDEDGVSRHPNHISCFAALQFLYTNGWIPADTQVFVLESVRLLRKYVGAFDLFASYLTSPFLCLGSPRPVWRAMRAHRSQLVWFRFLYMIFSRYVVINTLRRIAMHRYMAKKVR